MDKTMRMIIRQLMITSFFLGASLVYAEPRISFIDNKLPDITLTEQQLKKYKIEAKKGNTNAQLDLGRYYFNYKNYQESLKWYTQAADKNNALAIKMVGRNKAIIANSCSIETPYLFKAAELGDAGAQNSIGVYYSQGYCGMTTNQQKAIEWYEKAVKQHNALAEYNLGIQYEFGWGVNADPSMAANLYQKAVDQNHSKAKANLGLLYLSGRGVTQDSNKGLNLLEQSAEQGYALAQNNLGILYKYGSFTSKDEQKAFLWFQKAANQGSADSQYLLGQSYLYGAGTKQNTQQALYWLQLASKHNTGALIELGNMYLHGLGVSKNPEKALQFFMDAENTPIKLPCEAPSPNIN